MNTAKIVQVEDFQLFDDIKPNSFVITATKNLSNLFSNAEMVVPFNDLIKEFEKEIDYANVANHTEFEFFIHTALYENIDCKRVKSFQNCEKELSKLFSKLLLNDIKKEDIERIDFNKYSFVEEDILKVYLNVKEKLNEKKLSIFEQAVVKQISNQLQKYNTIIFVGFVFFNDLQESLIKELKNETLIFVNKKNDFIEEQLIGPLMRSQSRAIESVIVEKESKNPFKNLENVLFSQEKTSLPVGTQVAIFEPFFNREDEFLFIAKQISKSIKSRNLDAKSAIADVKNYAVVLTKEKERYAKILDDAFAQYGIFVPPENLSLKQIFFSKAEFLSEKITLDNKELSYLEKLKLFETFQRIKVTGLPIIQKNFPIGKFVLEVYKILAKGLTLESFKTLLYTEWYFDEEKENCFIQDFERIETFFAHLNTFEQWSEQIDKLIELKQGLKTKEEMQRHPLWHVKETSLRFLKDFIRFVGCLVEQLKVDGNIKQQIDALIDAFSLKKLILTKNQQQEMLSTFLRLLGEIKSNPNLCIDYKFFAEHIVDLLEHFYDYAKSDQGAIKLAVVNMENYTKYDFVYFPMFEDNKYPRVLKNEFPFSANIISLLNDLNVKIDKNLDLQYHLKMSRHIFKNIFSFSKKKIFFTYINKENGRDLTKSVYAYDVFSSIGQDIKLLPSENKKTPQRIDRDLIFRDANISSVCFNQLFYSFVCPKFFYVTVSGQMVYIQNKNLLQFYAKALIFNTFFAKLGESCKDYFSNQADFDNDVDQIFESSFFEVIKYFDCFNQSVKNAIKKVARKSVDDFINVHIRSGKFKAKHFAFELSKATKMRKKFDVNFRSRLILKNLDKRTKTKLDFSQNLDFLVSSCGGKKYDFHTFWQVLEQLKLNNQFDDKMALASQASFELEKILRDEENSLLLDYVVSQIPLQHNNLCESISSFCKFCPLKEKCKEVYVDDK